jgi:hypothetical protein
LEYCSVVAITDPTVKSKNQKRRKRNHTIKDTRLLEISHGCRFHDVRHTKPLDRLVLRAPPKKTHNNQQTDMAICAQEDGFGQRAHDQTCLWDGLGAVVAADEPDMAAAVLVAAVVPALHGLRFTEAKGSARVRPALDRTTQSR